MGSVRNAQSPFVTFQRGPKRRPIVPRLRVIFSHDDEPHYVRLLTRWISLSAAAACFIWCGSVWMERRSYQAEAQKTFAELDKPSAAPRVQKAFHALAAPPPMAKLEIARLHVSGFVEDGLDSQTLSRAIGHSPRSAKLGEPGNVVLAAHRDTFFAGLKDVRTGDAIEVQAADGTVYRYKVTRILIVDPTEDWVLKSDPSRNMLTLITCYPFQFIGSAPNRMVVQAEPVGSREVARGSLLSRDRSSNVRSASEGI